jgi:uncharacterized protein YbjT (DUF2867 family)
MNIVLTGATGMVGQGALRECLNDPGVTRVVTLGRRATGQRHEKLRELVVPDLFDLSAVEAELRGFDAAFYCLGVSAVGMSEADYARLSYDLTLSIATTLARLNPAMTFLYVSGAGTDSSEQGRVMWARVKGRTENALLRLPFRAAYMLRPGLIMPRHGIRSRTKLYNAIYPLISPLYPVIRALVPHAATTTEDLGRAMLDIARRGAPKPVLEMRDLVPLAK